MTEGLPLWPLELTGKPYCAFQGVCTNDVIPDAKAVIELSAGIRMLKSAAIMAMTAKSSMRVKRLA